MKRHIFGILALASTMLAPPAISAEKTRFTAMDVFELEHAADPRIAPDGNRIIYVRNFADVRSDARYSNLWIIGADGTGHRAITTGMINAHTPRWSPDGSKLAFISNANALDDPGAKPQVYIRDSATGDVTMVSRLPEAPSDITWSPDGTQIAFTMLKREAAPIIADMPSPPAGATWQTLPRITDKMVYRFNGAGYLPHGYNHIYVIPAEGGTPRQISSGDYQHAGPGSRAGSLSWTPDGSSIVVSANRRVNADWEPFNTEVYAFDVATGAVTQLTDRDGPDSAATVSPDGKWVAYTGFDDKKFGFQRAALYIQDMKSGERRILTDDLDRGVHAHKWAADSKGLYFAYDSEGVTRLSYVNTSGKRRDIIDNVGGDGGYSAYGGSASFTISRSGKIAAVRADSMRAEDIAVGTSARDFKTITDVNGDLFAQRKIGKVEEINYKSSVDNRDVQGWLVYPPDFDASKKYPLMIEIHGGPFANYGPRFDFEKQYVAAQDYVVLYVNPRGSTSYGAEFANLIHHAYPGDDFYDLNSGVDAAIAKGGIDINRLYVAGGSGGGVLTSWMIGKTNRFKAAIIYYPVIEWESFNLTTDIPFVNNYWFPGVPWKHREHYGKRSLLSVIEKVETPSLLITGEADYRTPISQTEQYYTALKIRGIEATMIRVPDEPHGIRVHPSHWLVKIMNTVGWMDKHK